jgi:hypothetical protein
MSTAPGRGEIMSHCVANITFDTDFRVPRDCLREGRVTCQIIRSECEILDEWDDRVTIVVRLRLKLTVKSGELLCKFERVVTFKETVWLDTDAPVTGCKVTAAGCKCVLRRGEVRCSAAVSIRFHLACRPEPICPCPEPVCCPRPQPICPAPQPQVCLLPILVLPILLPGRLP